MTAPLYMMQVPINLNELARQAGDRGWIILLLLCVAGAAARHAMIGGPVLGLRKEWALAPVTASIAAAIMLASSNAAATTGTPGVLVPGATFAEARVVIATRCASCHSSVPTDQMFTVPPNGIVLDTPQQISGLAARILERVVIQRTMPFANKSGMTDEEREVLRRWIESGAPLR